MHECFHYGNEVLTLLQRVSSLVVSVIQSRNKPLQYFGDLVKFNKPHGCSFNERFKLDQKCVDKARNIILHIRIFKSLFLTSLWFFIIKPRKECDERIILKTCYFAKNIKYLFIHTQPALHVYTSVLPGDYKRPIFAAHTKLVKHFSREKLQQLQHQQ